MKGIPQRLPRARQSGLITREVAGEMLVYDRNSDEAHCLNPTAALVWANCDGRTTIAEMARLLEAEMETAVADDIVWFALDQLEQSSLLDDPWKRPAKIEEMSIEQMSRRSLVKRLGIAAAVTLPLVTSIIAPAAAAAASCLPVSAPCTVDAQCCSNNCANNGRGTFNCM